MPKWYFEDFVEGFTIERSGTPIQAEEIKAFASQFDPQYFHTDEEAARKSLFGALCCSGWHTSSMCMRLMCDAYLLDSASLGSPGIDELRWVKPVFAGDTLTMKMIVLEARPSRSKPHLGSVRARWEVFNQHQELVMHMTGWGLFGKRSTAS
jgi:acyl dehydratase